MHVCGDHCRAIPGLVEAHERSRLSARRKRLAKFKGRAPKVRWLGGHPPPKHWIDEMWAMVEQQ
jgi:hypothetical protein